MIDSKIEIKNKVYSFIYHFEYILHIDYFALSDFVLCTRVHYKVSHFAPSGFVLRTRILSLFVPSSLVLCAHILLALLMHVLRFALTKFFFSIEWNCSETHRNA